MKLNQQQIKRLQKIGVNLVYLFGSYAEGKTSPLSDIDIGIVLSRDAFSLNLSMIYNELYDIFTDVFPGKKVDIVFLQKASLELRFDVVSHGKILYAETIGGKLSFEEETMLFYADFKPLLNEFDKAILGG